LKSARLVSTEMTAKSGRTRTCVIRAGTELRRISGGMN